MAFSFKSESFLEWRKHLCWRVALGRYDKNFLKQLGDSPEKKRDISANGRGLCEVADERDGIILNHQSEEGNLGEGFRLCVASPKKPEPDKPLL
ncbi:hypothetical protein KJ632_04710 [Patescibacteria group bacterium]|nr:hypothetical protein [Patescibacteria group bacterium]